MSANLEWDIPFTIDSDANAAWGALDLNTTAPGDRIILDRSACLTGPGLVSGSALRVTRDYIPQADGEIMHEDEFQPGYEMRLAMQLWNNPFGEGDITVAPACAAQLRSMGERIYAHAFALLHGSPGRITWTPTPDGSNDDDRILDGVKMMSWPVPTTDGADGLVTITFEVYTGFPYAIDLTPGSPTTVPGTLTNLGNHDFYPVFRVHGATDVCVITNNSILDENGVALQIHYNSSLPGGQSIPGGHFAEIDCFRNTVYLGVDGGPGNGANLKANIDMELTEFFWLKPGANEIDVTFYDGAGVDVLWNSAWA